MKIYLYFALIAQLVNSALGAEITSVTPSSAAPGDTVTVTMTVGGQGVPPSQVQPTSMSIGSVAGTSVSRSNNDCTATFTIPAAQSAGTLDCVVIFPSPNGAIEITLTGGFEVTAGANAPPSITAEPESQTIVLGVGPRVFR